jgi:hypothetical protein
MNAKGLFAALEHNHSGYTKVLKRSSRHKKAEEN